MSASDLASILPAMGHALVWLVVSGFFTTLYASLVVTQDAGLERLIEKYPPSAERLARNEFRWDTLRAATLLSSMLSATGAITIGALALDPDAAGFRWELGIMMVGTAVLLSMLLNVFPRVLSEGYADLLSVRCLPFLVVLSRILYPLAWPLARLEQKLMRWALSGIDEENRPSHEDEIKHLVDQVSQDELEQEEREIIKSVFEFGETVTRETMTPRIDVIGLPDSATIAEVAGQLTTSPHSRFPVYHDTLDDIRGVVHVKELLRLVSEGRGGELVGAIANAALFVPGTMPINDLLQRLRAEQEQLAVVVDEYGGTSGLVTMEDVIEELVGDIHDEYDDERTVIQQLPNGSTILDARMPIDEVNKLLGASLPESEEYDSFGGFVYTELGRIPRAGEAFTAGGLSITVHAATARRIQTLEVVKSPVTNKA